MSLEQADQEISSRFMSEARRRSAIDRGRRMTHGDAYDESLFIRSPTIGRGNARYAGSLVIHAEPVMTHTREEHPCSRMIIGSTALGDLHEEKIDDEVSLQILGSPNVFGLDKDSWTTLHFELASFTSRYER